MKLTNFDEQKYCIFDTKKGLGNGEKITNLNLNPTNRHRYLSYLSALLYNALKVSYFKVM